MTVTYSDPEKFKPVTVEGDLETLEAGDALVVRYTAKLDGMPAVFLPELDG